MLMYGVRLKELRKEKRLTIDECSADLGINRSTYNGYERRFRKPPIEFLAKAAQYYNVSTDYIIGLTDERDPKIVESNVQEYLKKGNLNWDGVPLTDEELKPIREILEIVVRDRLPQKKTEITNQEKKAII